MLCNRTCADCHCFLSVIRHFSYGPYSKRTFAWFRSPQPSSCDIRSDLRADRPARARRDQAEEGVGFRQDRTRHFRVPVAMGWAIAFDSALFFIWQNLAHALFLSLILRSTILRSKRCSCRMSLQLKMEVGNQAHLCPHNGKRFGSLRLNRKIVSISVTPYSGRS